MRTILFILMTCLIVSFVDRDKLTGRWQSQPSSKGNVTTVEFKPDNSFEGFINRKPFVTGTYKVEDSILTFVDNGCNGMTGIYKLDFFSKGDSLRFVAVKDSCVERNKGMSRLVMGRVKPLK